MASARSAASMRRASHVDTAWATTGAHVKPIGMPPRRKARPRLSFAQKNSRVMALDAASGKPAWRFEIHDRIPRHDDRP